MFGVGSSTAGGVSPLPPRGGGQTTEPEGYKLLSHLLKAPRKSAALPMVFWAPVKEVLGRLSSAVGTHGKQVMMNYWGSNVGD